MAETGRPILITILGVLYALAGLVLIITGILALVGTTISGLSDANIDGTAAGIICIVCGLIPFAIGYGLLKGWKIMWYLGVIFGVLGLIVGIVGFSIIAIVIFLIILYYLTRPKVKTFFGL